MNRKRLLLTCYGAVLISMVGLAPATAANRPVTVATVEPRVWELVQTEGQARVLVYLLGQADLQPAYGLTDWTERGQFVYGQLQALQRGSGDLYAWLEKSNARPHRLLTANAVAADVGAGLLAALARRPEVWRIGPNAPAGLVEVPDVSGQSPRPATARPVRGTAEAVEWNIAKIGADLAWADFGVRGQGVVVGDIGTGVMVEHAALVQQYRGNLGSGVFDHNYNWFDIVDGWPAPFDDNGHSTFGVGVAIGDDGGANQIGVAPAAKWIAVKALDNGSATLEDLHAAMEWMLAPTDLNGANPDPAKRPNVGLNMWGLWGGCDPEFSLDVQAWQAAGILPVFAIGSEGPGCSLIRSPADMVGTFTAGATDMDDDISGFSARGPSCWGPLKPEVSAPGVNIRSSTNDGGYDVWSGTSFAAAHLAGAAALVLSADPSLNLDDLTAIVKETAVCREDLTCGGSPCPEGMNNVYGWGRIDAYEAVAAAWGGLPPMHVSRIRLTARDRSSGKYVLQGAVRVLDETLHPVEEAAVSVEWAYPDASIVLQEALTGLTGTARFRLQSRQWGVHQLCVTAIAKAGWRYDPSQNVETCEATTVP